MVDVFVDLGTCSLYPNEVFVTNSPVKSTHGLEDKFVVVLFKVAGTHGNHERGSGKASYNPHGKKRVSWRVLEARTGNKVCTFL